MPVHISVKKKGLLTDNDVLKLQKTVIDLSLYIDSPDRYQHPQKEIIVRHTYGPNTQVDIVYTIRKCQGNMSSYSV